MAIGTFTPRWNATLRPFESLRVAVSMVERRQAQGCPERSRGTRRAGPRDAGWIGQPERAAALLDPVSAGPTFDSYTQQCLLLQAALAGDRAAFDRALVPEFVETARLDGQGASTLGEYYSLLGDHDAAIDWLEVAVSRGWINDPLYARTDPFLEPLRSLPRFREFLERVRVLWEHFDE